MTSLPAAEVLAGKPPQAETPPLWPVAWLRHVFVLVAVLHTLPPSPHSHPPAMSLPGIFQVSVSQFPPLIRTPVKTTSELRLVHYGPSYLFYICKIRFPNEVKFRNSKDWNRYREFPWESYSSTHLKYLIKMSPAIQRSDSVSVIS